MKYTIMETIEILVIGGMLVFLIVFIVSTMMIFDYLKNKGEKVNFFLIRLFMISYADKYKQLTKRETGKIGYLFYLWIFSINLLLLFVIIYIFIYK